MCFNVIRSRGFRSCYSVKTTEEAYRSGTSDIEAGVPGASSRGTSRECTPYESAFYGPVCDCRFHYIELLCTPVLILLHARGRIVGPRRSAVSCHVLPLHRSNSLAVAGCVSSLACVHVDI